MGAADMAHTAAPAYLGTQHQEASPALRFGLLCPIWNEQWGKDAKAAQAALKSVTRLSSDDAARLRALALRQAALFAPALSSGQALRLHARAMAPFTTGLGNEHPLENGFAFLNPHGLPYLAGSGVKGVLRQAARELAGGSWGDPEGWSLERGQALRIDGKTVAFSVIDALFGLETEPGEKEHVRGALSFWDTLPQFDQLRVDVMTPHQTHYHQEGQTPHESASPVPINFLTVPPGTAFVFHVVCDTTRLQRLAPGLADRWQPMVQAAFAHAYAWLGFGAKTAVGYGEMAADEAADQAQQTAERRLREAEAQQAQAASLAQMSPGQRAVEKFSASMQSAAEVSGLRKQPLGGQFYSLARELAKDASIATDWSAEEKSAAADAIELWVPKLVNIDAKDLRKRLTLGALRQP